MPIVLGALSESVTVSLRTTVAASAGQVACHGSGGPPHLGQIHPRRPQHRRDHRLAHLHRGRRVEPQVHPEPLGHRFGHACGEGGGVQVRERHDRLGPAQPDRAGHLGRVAGNRLRVVVHVEHDLVPELHFCDRFRCDRAAYQHGRTADRPGRNVPADQTRRPVECRDGRDASRLEHDARARQLEPPPGDGVALKPVTVLPAGPKAETAELVGHVLRGQLEAPARRVAAEHGVVRQDSDSGWRRRTG